MDLDLFYMPLHVLISIIPFGTCEIVATVQMQPNQASQHKQNVVTVLASILFQFVRFTYVYYGLKGCLNINFNLTLMLEFFMLWTIFHLKGYQPQPCQTVVTMLPCCSESNQSLKMLQTHPNRSKEGLYSIIWSFFSLIWCLRVCTCIRPLRNPCVLVLLNLGRPSDQVPYLVWVVTTCYMFIIDACDKCLSTKPFLWDIRRILTNLVNLPSCLKTCCLRLLLCTTASLLV